MNNFSKKLNYSSPEERYSVFNFTNGNTSFDRFDSKMESICILPFFKNQHDKIESVILAECSDLLNEGSVLTCITQAFDQDKYLTSHECFKEAIYNNLGVSEIQTDDIFYLGKVSHTIPFNKKYRCYAVNLSNNYDSFKDIDQASLKNKNQKISDLKKIKFSSIVNGHVEDSLCLSCSLLLVSYFS